MTRHRPPLWLAVGGALLLFALAFLPHLGGEFVWDDRVFIRDNPVMLDPGGGRALLTQPFAAGGAEYRPLSTITFWLQVQLTGLWLPPLRLGNWCLHGVTAVLLALWLRKLGRGWASGARDPPSRPTSPDASGTAADTAIPAVGEAGGSSGPSAASELSGLHFWLPVVVAYAFLIHPNATEVAMFVSARNDVLATALALGALLAWPRSGSRPSAYLGPSLLASLAVTGKEVFVILPILCAIEAERTRPAEVSRVRAWAPVLVPSLAIGGFFLWRFWLGIPSSSDQLKAPLSENLIAYATILWHYGSLCLAFRNGLTAGRFVPCSVTEAIAVYGLLVGLGLGVAWLRRRRVREALWIGFGLAWFSMAWAPNVLAIPWLGQYANRYAYFPNLGLFAVAFALLHWGLRSVAPRLRRLVAVASVPALVAVALGTSTEAAAWRSSLALFGKDVARAPTDSRALYHYGVAVSDEHGCAEALPIFVAAARHEPRYARAWHNVTGCLINLGRFHEAVKAGERTVQLGSSDPGNLYNLGVALVATGQQAQGISLLERAVRLAPDRSGWRHVLEEARQRPAAK
ncbi:MAG: tetratricopeptide repeat protein [Polyangiaceae bacterium]|nr:tetratricopeptide repeat protein [Polyangiaceae bacterium]